MPFLDDLIGRLSPAWAAQRARARYQARVWADVMASYDGASKSARTRFWKRPGTSANAEIGPALATLRNGARELVRNDALAARAKQAIVGNVIGTGILPETVGAPGERIRARYEDLARAHLDTTACDADGRNNLYGIQALAFGTMVEAGEAIIRRRRRRVSDGLPVPVQYQVLEGDFLDTLRDGPVPGGGFAVQGVEFDAIGRRVAYWLFTQHPGDATWRRTPESVRVPAEDVIHLFRADRPGQVRGVTWLAPIMLGLKDFAEYRDAQLVRQKIAACFAIFETDMFTDEALPAGGLTGAAAQGSGNENRQVSVEPGMYQKLGPGRDVKFANPPGVTGYREYTVETKHDFAAGLGITYQTLTGDLREVNFSSGRMGWLQEQRNIMAWQELLAIPQLCEPLWRWFAEAVVLTAPLPLLAAKHTPPAREMIDPTKEGPAERDMVRAGQMTPSDMIRRRGKDPDKHWAEYQADMERIATMGLVLDSDPRSTTRAGAAMGSSEPEAPPPAPAGQEED